LFLASRGPVEVAVSTEKRDVDIRLEEYANLRRTPEWDKWRLICLVLGAASICAAVTGFFIAQGQSGMEFYGAAAGAFLTVAGVVPAIVGILLVDRPSTKIDGGWVVWVGSPFALSIGLVLVWFVGGLSSMLALASPQIPGPPQGFAVAVVVVALLITAAIPLDMLLIVRRLGARDSTRVAVSRVIRPRWSLSRSRVEPAKAGAEVIKDLRDSAMLEAQRGDRRAVRERMVGLAHISRTCPGHAIAAVEELGFLGAALVHDRDQALDAVAMLNQIGPSVSDGAADQAVHELQSIWERALERKGSRRVGDSCAQALHGYFALHPHVNGNQGLKSVASIVDTAVRTQRLGEALPSIQLLVAGFPANVPGWVAEALEGEPRPGEEPAAPANIDVPLMNRLARARGITLGGRDRAEGDLGR